MSETTPERSGEPKSNRKAWRVIFEFFAAWWLAGLGGTLFSSKSHSPWVVTLGEVFLILGGIVFVIHGIHAIRWRQGIAEFWASTPGANWLVWDTDPVRHHRGKVVMGGVLAIFMGSVIVLSFLLILLQSIVV